MEEDENHAGDCDCLSQEEVEDIEEDRLQRSDYERSQGYPFN